MSTWLKAWVKTIGALIGIGLATILLSWLFGRSYTLVDFTLCVAVLALHEALSRRDQ